jgi:membrane protease YdiL (CAAX protease family)
VRAFWTRLPVVVRAILTGGAVAAAGTLPWAALVAANIRYGSAVPWAVLPTALYLWGFWRWAHGAGWPSGTAAARRRDARANSLSDEVWSAALGAGVVGLVALVLFQQALNRMVTLPAQPADDLLKIPGATLAAALVTSAAVSGLVEETAFRGFMQRPIEERHGPTIAILVTGAMFGFAHFNHPEVTLSLMPFYLAVAAIYGGLAYLTDSTLPGMVLHGGGNVLGSLDLLVRGRAEWQTPATPQPLVWETGADASFWMLCLAVLLAVAGTVWAYAGLARVAASLDTRAPRT